jgi:hypothetical protein
MHRQDPLANLNLTNNGMEAVMKPIRDFSKHLLLLGGGGYDVKATTRAWCRMWATVNRIDSLPDYMVTVGGTFLGGEGVPGAEIIDMHYHVTGPERTAINEELDRIAVYHETTTLPLIERTLAKPQ